MEELLTKLTEEEKENLGNLLEKVHQIFEESDNITEDDWDKYCSSKLSRGIEEAMYALKRWC